jgi:hypothetical protein
LVIETVEQVLKLIVRHAAHVLRSHALVDVGGVVPAVAGLDELQDEAAALLT